MSSPPLLNPRGILLLWGLLVLAGFIAAQGVTAALGRYAAGMREQDYRTYVVAGTDAMNRFDFAAALEQANEAKRKGPNAPEPFGLAGHIHYQLKQWRQAIVEYKQAIIRGSRDEGVPLNTVWALIELQQYEEAVTIGKAAVASGFTMPALYRYIAEACFRSGKLVDAIPYYEEALKGYPNDLYLLDHLRQAYRSAKRLEKAEEMRARIADIEASLNKFVTPGAQEPPATSKP